MNSRRTAAKMQCSFFRFADPLADDSREVNVVEIIAP